MPHDTRISSIFLGAIFALLFSTAPAFSNTHSNDPMDWLIQHVCVDASNKPIPADPYNGCPAGSRERRLALGDPIPYLRHDQPGKNNDHPDGFQRHDARPMIDMHAGTIVSANDFDFDYIEPYGIMHPGDGDGFDLYRVVDGYVGGGSTRDGSGYSQTFFGPDCRPYGGWIFFPVIFLQSLQPGANGRGVFPLHGDYWEQNGEPWPGRCATNQNFSRDTLTTWEFIPAYPFGGHNGTTPKQIDAVVSTHGLPVQHNSQSHYHLERFYFTDLYGVTRWEAWVPNSENPKTSENCGGPTQMTYEGVDFTLSDCRDWSVVDLINPPRSHLPWAYPEANLLQNWHFDHDGMEPWQRTNVTSDLGNIINWGRFTSTGSADVQHSQNHIGVRYLQTNCGGHQCTPGEAIYQDVPVANLPHSAIYDYGFSGVRDGDAAGPMKVTLSQIDQDGH